MLFMECLCRFDVCTNFVYILLGIYFLVQWHICFETHCAFQFATWNSNPGCEKNISCQIIFELDFVKWKKVLHTWFQMKPPLQPLVYKRPYKWAKKYKISFLMVDFSINYSIYIFFNRCWYYFRIRGQTPNDWW